MKQILFCCISLLIIISGCSTSVITDEETDSSTVVSLACWNTQTFFDAEIEGTEYEDFQNLAKWSRDKYLQRLSRLCETIKSLNADVIVLEEIENTAVVQDIANQLAGNSWDKNKNWTYGAFGKDAGAAIGCAVFSRYELQNLKLHSMLIKTQKTVQPSVRPLLEVTVMVEEKPVVLFVNHWKSKSGGEEASEIWRDWQEALLADRVARTGIESACVMCGDFNRDAREFICSFSGKNSWSNTILRGTGNTSKNNRVEVYSPWFNSSGSFATETGSYYYNKSWERIDHIFVSGAVKLSAFSPRTDGDWAGVGGVPNAYKLYTGEGYSDHLPLMCTLTLF